MRSRESGMTPSEQSLYERIRSFDIDGGPVEQTFEARLGAEQGWSSSHAARVVSEYRRFLLLAVTGDQAVTPSRAIDEAWHLHLTYTRSYWERLCPKVFGGPLHHDPTTGGVAEDAKYRHQYQATLDRYREVFGAAPPVEVWPDRRMPDRATGRGRDRRAVAGGVGAIGLAFGGIAIAGCSAASQISNTEKYLLFGFVAFVILIVIVALLHRWGTGGGHGGCGGGASSCGGSGCGGGCGGGGD